MSRQTLVLKGMVCSRCISVLKRSLEQLSLTVEDIHLGKVTISGLHRTDCFSRVEKTITSLGFTILRGQDQRIVERIKALVDEVLIAPDPKRKKIKFSEFLSDELHLNYDALSAIFSRSEAVTLENYIINRRIDKIKEYLVYTDMTLAEIAFVTGYSSMFHLSRQFKRVTSFNPSYYKAIRARRKALMAESVVQ
ncbi:MAG TPA: AraC family transcriptional regulator [Sphingobacteriaceae bacterium]